MNHHQLFNKNSALYAKVRPQYPAALFAYLASLCKEHHTVWDVACGNGQAALSLTKYFEQVEATDVSEQQIAHAAPHPQINYSVQPAEKTTFQTNQFDLVTVAQALHWFDYNQFWPEVQRALKPNGIFAAWGYSWFTIEEKIDAVLQEKFLNMLEPYWAPQNKLLWDRYRDVPFPFKQIPVPKFEMKMELTLDQLFAYLQSWSATRICIEQNGDSFLIEAYNAITHVWGKKTISKQIDMDFCILIGQNEKS